MKLIVERKEHFPEETRGELYIDGKFECYTLEDEHHDTKVKGDTRIPAGTYPIVLRKEGGHHAKYAKEYPDMHKGMLHVSNVPNFQWILIHKGNTEENTEGCLLVGRKKGKLGSKNAVLDSGLAYETLYPKVLAAIEKGENVTIQYIDL